VGRYIEKNIAIYIDNISIVSYRRLTYRFFDISISCRWQV